MDIRTFYIYIFWLNIHFYHQIIYFYHTYLNSSSFQERMRPVGDFAGFADFADLDEFPDGFDAKHIDL